MAADAPFQIPMPRPRNPEIDKRTFEKLVYRVEKLEVSAGFTPVAGEQSSDPIPDLIARMEQIAGRFESVGIVLGELKAENAALRELVIATEPAFLTPILDRLAALENKPKPGRPKASTEAKES